MKFCDPVTSATHLYDLLLDCLSLFLSQWFFYLTTIINNELDNELGVDRAIRRTETS